MVPLYAQTWSETNFTAGTFFQTATTTGAAEVQLAGGPLTPVVWGTLANASATEAGGKIISIGNFIYAFRGGNTRMVR